MPEESESSEGPKEDVRSSADKEEKDRDVDGTVGAVDGTVENSDAAVAVVHEVPDRIGNGISEGTESQDPPSEVAVVEVAEIEAEEVAKEVVEIPATERSTRKRKLPDPDAKEV